MSKILMITLGFQYLIGMILTTTNHHVFGWLDLFVYIMFIIQSIALLAIIFLYINGTSEKNMSEKVQNIVNLLTNLIIFLSVIIIAGNIVIFYLIDLI